MRTKNAIAVASIDGLATLESGIASVVHWFFEEFNDIRAQTPALQRSDWTLYALSPQIDVSSPDFSPTVHGIVSSVCKTYGGSFEWFPVADSSSLRAVWSLDQPHRWEEMCQALAASVRQLCARHDQVTVLVHGIMLTALRSYLPDVDNVQVVFVAHSLGRVFEDKASDHRTRFEDRAFADMARFPQDRIGYIGSYFQGILTERYGRTAEQLVPLINGIPRNSFRFPPDTTSTERKDYLSRHGIPMEKNLIFSWGRCTGQKGFDTLIPAYRKLLHDISNDWHLVLLMPQEVSPPEYVALLDDQLEELPVGSYTAIRNFDGTLPYYLLREQVLKVVVFASRFEGAPLSVLEALQFGHPNLTFVWHDIPSISQFLGNLQESFPFPSLEPRHIADALLRATRADQVNGERVCDGFSTNTSAGLQSVLEWWE
ncbi:glycosyltransferase [Streptomyces guryensis]|uniref:Glycosyltransferase n=1 Tax=Streptomyces guryensis TaxID=2886947 RepID=A0A9Q3VRW6_9ACTN|nr:glycosyltransferase [Streptomyces guryensis]MCD9878943.1 glycosyltransferase [Streptomyces guryensis]